MSDDIAVGSAAENASAACQALARHFKGLKRHKYTVDLGGETLVVYVSPRPLTVRQALRERIDAKPPGLNRTVATIVELAEDAAGAPLFDGIADPPVLKRACSADVLAELAVRLLTAFDVDIGAPEAVEEAGKD